MNLKNKIESHGVLRGLSKSTHEGIDTFHRFVKPIAEQNEAKLPDPSFHPLTKRIADILDASPISIMVPCSVADKIATTGRMKNLFETGDGKGTTDRTVRASWEKRMYNIGSDVSPHLRPLYGFLNPHAIHHDNRDFKGLPFPNTLKSYGEILVDLKPEVRSRSTFTNGDSADLQKDSVVTHKGIRRLASHIGLSSALQSLERFVDGFNSNQASDFPNYYVEAQIHGGVYPKDVEAIHFAWNHPSKNNPSHHYYDVFDNFLQSKPEQIAEAEKANPYFWYTPSGIKIKNFLAAKRLANAFEVPLHVHVVGEGGERLDKKTFLPDNSEISDTQPPKPLSKSDMPTTSLVDLSQSLYDAASLSDLHHTDESPYHRHTDELMATASDKHRLSKDALKIAVMDYLLDNQHRNRSGLNFHVSEHTGTPKHLVAIHNDVGYQNSKPFSLKNAISNLPSKLDLGFISNRPHEVNALHSTMQWWAEHSPFIRMAFDNAIESFPQHRKAAIEEGFNKRADLLDSMSDKWSQSKDLGVIHEGHE